MPYNTWLQKLGQLYDGLDISSEIPAPLKTKMDAIQSADIKAGQVMARLSELGFHEKIIASIDKDKLRASIDKLSLKDQDALIGMLGQASNLPVDQAIESLASAGIQKDVLDPIKNLPPLDKHRLVTALFLFAHQQELPGELRRALYAQFASSYGAFFDWKQQGEPPWPGISFSFP